MGAKGLIATGAPHEPAWLLYVKGAIIVLSLVVLALSAYALSAFAYGGAPGFTIFLVSRASFAEFLILFFENLS